MGAPCALELLRFARILALWFHDLHEPVSKCSQFLLLYWVLHFKQWMEQLWASTTVPFVTGAPGTTVLLGSGQCGLLIAWGQPLGLVLEGLRTVGKHIRIVMD